MSNRSIHATISGRVQGVCFRYYTRETARRLGVHGWVKNLNDGRVELTASGDEAAMNRFEEWIAHGPPGAQVTDLQKTVVANAPAQYSFEIVGSGFEPV